MPEEAPDYIRRDGKRTRLVGSLYRINSSLLFLNSRAYPFTTKEFEFWMGFKSNMGLRYLKTMADIGWVTLISKRREGSAVVCRWKGKVKLVAK